MHNQFQSQKFKHLMLAMGPRDLHSAPYSPVHCSSHSMTSFQCSELTELPVVEHSQLFAQRVHSARYAPTASHGVRCRHSKAPRCTPHRTGALVQRRPPAMNKQKGSHCVPLGYGRRCGGVWAPIPREHGASGGVIVIDPKGPRVIGARGSSAGPGGSVGTQAPGVVPADLH